MGIFGFDSSFYDPFDFNQDGQRSPDEDFMEFMVFNEVVKSCEKDDEEEDSSNEE